MRLLGLVAILAIGALAQDDFDEFGGVRFVLQLNVAFMIFQDEIVESVEVEEDMTVEVVEEEPEPANDEGELLNDQAMDPDEYDDEEFENIPGFNIIFITTCPKVRYSV